MEINDAAGLLVTSNNNNNYGQFTVKFNKVNGSLGFSLRSDPEDTTALRHSVRALVREPAISDGRIRPGDKLISANGQDCGVMTHTELISFLRSLPELGVSLKFYRDASRAQTPISTPTEGQQPDFCRSHPNLAFFSSHSGGSSGSLKLHHGSKQLRYEAKEMVRSLQASRTSLDGVGGSMSAGRPYSPSIARRNHPLTNSASSPFVMRQLSTDSDFYAEPMIETPLSPDTELLDPGFINLGHINQSQFSSSSLQIEELSPTPPERNRLALEIDAMIEDFECVFRENNLQSDQQQQQQQQQPQPQPQPQPQQQQQQQQQQQPQQQQQQPQQQQSSSSRPDHLDLFNPEKQCRTGYSFNNNHNNSHQ
jgi:hypothetical protein